MKRVKIDSLPKAQKGIEPTYVYSKDDPAYIAYNDSLDLYNQSMKPRLTGKKSFGQYGSYGLRGRNVTDVPLPEGYTVPGTIQPIGQRITRGYYPEYLIMSYPPKPAGKDYRKKTHDIYKEPTRPVVVGQAPAGTQTQKQNPQPVAKPNYNRPNYDIKSTGDAAIDRLNQKLYGPGGLFELANGGELSKAQTGIPADYQKFLQYSETAPENRRPTSEWQYGNPRQYDHYGMWDALGKPENFDQALEMNPHWQPDPYDGSYHGFSTNPSTGVWLKSHIPGESHPGDTGWMEYKDFMLSNDRNWGGKNQNLVYDPDLQRMRYIERKKEGGSLPKAQNGRNVLYVDSENDPNYIAAQDSSTIANATKNMIKDLHATPNADAWLNYSDNWYAKHGDPNSAFGKAFQRLTKLNKHKPNARMVSTLLPGGGNFPQTAVEYQPPTRQVIVSPPAPKMIEAKPLLMPGMPVSPQLQNISSIEYNGPKKQRVLINTPQGDKIRVQDLKTKKFIDWEETDGAPTNVENPTGIPYHDFKFANGGNISIPDLRRVKISKLPKAQDGKAVGNMANYINQAFGWDNQEPQQSSLDYFYNIGKQKPQSGFDYNTYMNHANKYLGRDTFKGTALTAKDLADAAQEFYNSTNYVYPVDLLLAQGQMETKLGKTLKSKNNYFNVGNTDEGATRDFKSGKDSALDYMNLMYNDYMNKGQKTPEQLLAPNSFVNYQGNRYASNPNYETDVANQRQFIKKYLGVKKQGGAVKRVKINGLPKNWKTK